MMYLAPNAGKRELPTEYGVLTSPAHGGVAYCVRRGYWWAVENECFTRLFDPGRFFPWLEKLLPYRACCLFVPSPDVVGNAIATLESFRWWGWRIKARAWPVAFVAQDGQENLPFPPEFDWLFIGGTTEWKMSGMVDDCILRAKRLGKRVHIGRVNSLKRYRHFALIGADTCDGTCICFEPDTMIRRFSEAMQWQIMPLLEKA